MDQQETIKPPVIPSPIVDNIKQSFTDKTNYDLAHRTWEEKVPTSEPEPQKPESALVAEFIESDSNKFKRSVEAAYIDVYKIYQRGDEENKDELNDIVGKIQIETLPENFSENEIIKDPQMIMLSRAATLLDLSKNYSLERTPPEIAENIANVIEKYPESLFLTDYADTLVNSLSSTLTGQKNFLSNSPLPETTRILKVISSKDSPLVATSKEKAELLYNEAIGYALFTNISEQNPQHLDLSTLSSFTKDILSSDQWSDIFRDEKIFVNKIPLLLAESSKDVDLPSQDKNNRKALTLGYISAMYDKSLSLLDKNSPWGQEKEKAQQNFDTIALTLIKLSNYDTNPDKSSFYVYISENQQDQITREITSIYNLPHINGNEQFQKQGDINRKRIDEEKIFQEKIATERSEIQAQQEITDLDDFAQTTAAIDVFNKINISKDPSGEEALTTLDQLKDSKEITDIQHQDGQQILKEFIDYSRDGNLVSIKKQQRGNKGFLGIGNTLHEVTVIDLNVQKIQELIKELTDQQIASKTPNKEIQTKIIALNLLSRKYPQN